MHTHSPMIFSQSFSFLYPSPPSFPSLILSSSVLSSFVLCIFISPLPSCPFFSYSLCHAFYFLPFSFLLTLPLLFISLFLHSFFSFSLYTLFSFFSAPSSLPMFLFLPSFSHTFLLVSFLVCSQGTPSFRIILETSLLQELPVL